MSVRINPQQARALGLDGSKPRAKARERRPKAPPPRLEPPGRLLALDPSSTAVGWAYFEEGVLKRVGVFRSSIEDPRRRIRRLAECVVNWARAIAPDVIAFELVSGQHRRAKPMAVATCSFAQGAIWAEIESRGLAGRIKLIKENEWTNGEAKAKRAKTIRLTQPIYAEFAKKDGDKGLDGADAVGLGLAYLGGLR